MTPDVAAILAGARPAGWVTEPLTRRILTAYDLPVLPGVWARSADAAAAGAEQLGYPVVVKVVSPEVVHKSDVGGVAVGIRDEDQLRQGYARLARLPAFDGVLVDPMAEGLELIVGAKNDPQFGAVVVVGIGGTSVEIYQDVAIRLAPLSAADADAALGALRARALLKGFRGAAPVHRASLVHLLVRFSEMAQELGDAFTSIDLNPVFCSPERAVIADARIVLPPP